MSTAVPNNHLLSRIHCFMPTHLGYSGLSQPVTRTFTLRTNNSEMPPAAYQALGQAGKGLPSPSNHPGLGERGVNPEECGMLSQAGRTASSSQLQHSATREHLLKQKLPVLGQLLTGAAGFLSFAGCSWRCRSVSPIQTDLFYGWKIQDMHPCPFFQNFIHTWHQVPL